VVVDRGSVVFFSPRSVKTPLETDPRASFSPATTFSALLFRAPWPPFPGPPSLRFLGNFGFAYPPPHYENLSSPLLHGPLSSCFPTPSPTPLSVRGQQGTLAPGLWSLQLVSRSPAVLSFRSGLLNPPSSLALSFFSASADQICTSIGSLRNSPTLLCELTPPETRVSPLLRPLVKILVRDLGKSPCPPPVKLLS